MILGTLKKKPSRAGALASIASAAGRLVTASSRIGVPDSPTWAVGSTSPGVEFVELVDVAQHLAHFDLEPLLLGRRKFQARQARDVPDLFKTDFFLCHRGQS